VAKLLLGREEVTDTVDYTGQIPRVYLARKGHVEVVNILLTRADIDPDRPGTYGSTPLMQATWSGYEQIVNALLERKEVNPDSQYNRS